ncbi:MAG: type VI secretion system tip protein VgrG [Bacteroidales bacterium]|nr:type VI secretion system tip protein VgrG [Bacteroidales bacterium]
MPQDRTIPTGRPATVVTPVIKIDGNEVARTVLVESITVRKEVNRVPWAKVVILDGNPSDEKFEASDGDLFIPGKEIEIKCGYESDTHTLFKGIIIKHSVKARAGGASMLVVECRDKAVRMTVGRKSKYYLDSKDSDIISEITGNYSGINANIDSTSVTHKEMVQYNCTDWDFILTRADANGRICIADDGQFSVKSPQIDQSSVLSLLYGATILDFDAEIDARHQLKKITSKAWSFTDQEILEAEGTDPAISLNGNLESSELADVIGLNKYQLNHGGKVEDSELQAWSNALMLRRQLARVRGRIKCKGTHNVKPGNIIEIGGIGERFNGNAFVSGIQHFIAAGDWLLDIQFGLEPEWFTEMTDISDRQAAGLISALHGLQVGIVTQIDNDPEGEDRIQVRIPIISNSDQGTWARVATLDAGNERGSFFRPEIGDEVIVGFINDDPRDPIVLGMMNSSAMPAPLTAEENNAKKGFVTRSEIKLLFDDEKKKFWVETPKGKTITLDEESDAISITDEHQNRIVMDSNGIVIESQGKIEIKAQQDVKVEGLNTDLKAQASMKMAGSASTEINASGSLTLKGSIVQIN